LYQYAELNPQIKGPINDWYEKVHSANWGSLTDIKNDFDSLDFVGNDRYVFIIKGNKFRLVVMIHFDIRTIYIRFIGTHAEYDKIDCTNI
jgi:mRNA interferase HigB